MKKNLLALSIATLLVGCGGGDGESSSSSNTAPSIPPTGTFMAYNGLAIIKPEQKVEIDLRNYVERGVEIVSMSMRPQEGCASPIEMDGMTFAVSLNEAAFCSYQYEVKSDAGKSGSATINVFATEAETPTLPGGSIALNAGDAAHTIDISPFVDGWSANHSIENTQVIVGEYGEVGGLTHTGNILTYTPPTVAGWNSILYTVVDATNPNIKQLGTIHVTISDDVNDAPVIDTANYEYTGTVIASQSVTIDLSALPGLSITDDGDWQLIDVQSYTANVAELAPDSTTNKQFTFITPTVGEHVVSYTVSDHMGGFATGLINITVSPNEREMTWGDIGIETTVGAYKYTATPRYSDVAPQLSVGNTWDAGVENTVATFNFEQADLFCSGNGRIPSLEEIRRLYEFGTANRETSGDYSAIPKQLPYITYSYTDSNVLLFDMNNGTSSVAVADSVGYVSCIKDFSLDLEILNTRAVANLDPTPIARITKGKDTSVVVSIVPGSLSDGDVSIAEIEETDNEILLVASGTIAGTFRVSVSGEGDTLTTPFITMTGDASAASAVNVIYDDYFENSALGKLSAGTGDILTATVDIADQYSNVIADKLAILEPISDTSNEYCIQPPVDDDGVLPPQECFFGEITFPSGKELISDVSGKLEFKVQADRDIFDENEQLIDWNYNVRVNDTVYNETIKLIHPDYESIVLINEISRTSRYVEFLVNSANLAEELTDGRLKFDYVNSVSGDIAYLIRHYDGALTKVANGSGYNVTKEGVVVRLLRFKDTGQDTTFRISLPASAANDSIKEVTLPIATLNEFESREIPYNIYGAPFQTINNLTTVVSSWIGDHVTNGYERINLVRTSSGTSRVINLPILTEEDLGITVDTWNKAGNSWYIGTNGDDPNSLYEISGGRYYRLTWIWLGDKWSLATRYVDTSSHTRS